MSAVLTLCGLRVAYAAAPMVETQPGFYRMMLGDFEITALSDGVVPYETARVLPTATPEQIKSALFEEGLADPVGMSYSAFLINTGSKLVLIDTGTGGKFDDRSEFHGTGHLIDNLRAAGYQPEQVDEIYITHLGPDHVGGLTIGTERAFPNAILRAPEIEVDLFRHPDEAPAWTKSWTQAWTAFRTVHPGGKIPEHWYRLDPYARYPCVRDPWACAGPYIVCCREQRSDADCHWRSCADGRVAVSQPVARKRV
jgi:hypothetical protein